MNPIYKFELSTEGESSNLLNPTTMAVGYYASWVNGELNENSAYAASDLIEVFVGNEYKAISSTNAAYTLRSVVFYDSRENFISGLQNVSSFTVPSAARYVRVTLGSGITFRNYSICLANKNFEFYGYSEIRQCFPVWGENLSKNYEKENGEEFFRAQLNGELTFEGDDYSFILGQSFDMRFGLEVFISYNAGTRWASYWRGTFWKTDCKFDEDSRTVTTSVTVNDLYKAVLDGIDKEFDLITLAPEIVSVRCDKRPMIQVYVPGQTVIGCFLAGMYWETECEAVTSHQDLYERYYFENVRTQRIARVEIQGSPTIPDVYMGAAPSVEGTDYTFTNGTHRLVYSYSTTGGVAMQTWQIVRVSDSTVMWQYQQTGQPTVGDKTLTLTPVSGTGASGNVQLYIHDVPVYARYICDVDAINNVATYPIPSDDLAENNRNYHRVARYGFTDTIFFSSRLTPTPTQWGIYQPGQYYQEPAGGYYVGEYFPVARSAWGRVSIWFAFSPADWIMEEAARASVAIRDAYPIYSVISVLLGQIAPGVSHEGTRVYSEFLYGTNFVTGRSQELVITPKSNVMSINYDQPAQKAPITLRQVLNMLRDCFRCYWWIDETTAALRIEHVSYFMNGGSYTGSPSVGVDLVEQTVPRNGKPWAFGRNQYEFDKPEMAGRYQFGWMDDVTQLFEGYPIDIISGYVQKDKIEQITVNQFTSDIDYILLNPSGVSKDGFAVMTVEDATEQSGSTRWIEVVNQQVEISEQTIERLVDLTGYRAKTMRITMQVLSSDGGSSGVYAYTQTVNGSAVATVGSAFVGEGASTYEFVVGANVAALAMYTSGINFVVRLVLEVQEGESHEEDVKKVPYLDLNNDQTHILQNGYMAFAFLQKYYRYDMPARNYKINGESFAAYGIKKLKKQSLKFPLLNDPNLQQLIRTNLGNGKIEKLSINLSSRGADAELSYDTE